MARVELGRTGIKVNVVGLGAGGDSRLGLKSAGADASVHLVRTALDLGIDFIDTAEAYGTEEVVGRAIAEVPRDRVVISTKKRTFDTVWTSATAAYENLDPLLRAYFETLTATNFVDVNGYSRTLHPDAEEEQRLHELRTKFPPIDVPVIITHPDTGKKAIFANQLHTAYIKGVTRAVSESLLRILFDALENPELHARFNWQRGSVAIWDNRLVQHRAIHDYGAERRVLYRVTLA